MPKHSLEGWTISLWNLLKYLEFEYSPVYWNEFSQSHLKIEAKQIQMIKDDTASKPPPFNTLAISVYCCSLRCLYLILWFIQCLLCWWSASQMLFSCIFVAEGRNLLYFLYILEFLSYFLSFLNNKTLKAYFIVLWIYLGRQSCLPDKVPKPHWNQEDVVTLLVAATSWGSCIFLRENEVSKVGRKHDGGFLI